MPVPRIPPSETDHEGRRSSLQDMVEEEYGTSFPVLTDDQAVALHNWFMFAKAVVTRHFLRSTLPERRELSRGAAAFISRDYSISVEVCRVMDARFRRHANSDFSRSVHRSQPYRAVADYLGIE